MKFVNRLLIASVLAIVAFTAQAVSMSDYLENKLVDHVFRATAFTAPLTLYVGLSTAACTDAGFGTEVTLGAYARVAVTSATTAWLGTHGTITGASSGTNGTISNAAAITFPAPTANWGVVTHFFIADALTGGNLLVCQALTTSKTINSGDAAPSFAASALTFQVDN